MTLAGRTVAPRITLKSPKIVTLDIERFKGRAEVEFWTLGDYKDRRIHAQQVVEWPRTICVAWRWYGTKKVEFIAEWDETGREAMLRAAWDVYDQADVLVGHNLAAFDTKHLNTEWRDLGLPAPSPFKVVDTLKEARKVFGDESKTLDAMCTRLGIPAKTDKYDVEVARRALAGNKAAQTKLKRYNQGDIVATEALYDRLRGWMSSHPHLGELNEATKRCNQCGSDDLQREGTVLAVQIRYVGYRCRNCGANLRSAAHSRASNIRGVR